MYCFLFVGMTETEAAVTETVIVIAITTIVVAAIDKTAETEIGKEIGLEDLAGTAVPVQEETHLVAMPLTVDLILQIRTLILLPILQIPLFLLAVAPLQYLLNLVI